MKHPFETSFHVSINLKVEQTSKLLTKAINNETKQPNAEYIMCLLGKHFELLVS